MTVHENLTTFHGLKVADFEPGSALPDPSSVASRLVIRYDGEISEFSELLAEFLATQGSDKTRALVVGTWSDPGEGSTSSAPAVEQLVASASRLPDLEALFFGDIISEENEISWIEQSDVSAFWGAFPKLQEFGVRGGNQLQLGRIRHKNLKKLSVQAGGLPRGVVQSIASADLPELEHLEVWLGTPDYGGDSTPADLAGILDGTRFPKLKTLALQNCAWGDDLATIVATAPVIKRIERLDLSMGTVGDAGVEAIAASPFISAVKVFDLHHHYASDAALDKVRALGITVNASDHQKPDEYGGELHRYVAVSE